MVADLNFEDATSVAEEITVLPERSMFQRENDIVELIDFTEANLGPIDLFCSNAGIGLGRDIDEPDEVWEKIWHVNTMSHVWAARKLVPIMEKRGGGYLLSTASAAGLQSNRICDLCGHKACSSSTSRMASNHLRREALKVSVLCHRLLGPQ